jgi:pteridine reductase
MWELFVTIENKMQKNVLITGAAKRIGATCARLLHGQGYNIFLHYRGSQSEALQLCNELNQQRSDSARIMAADLLSVAEIQYLAQQACSAWDGIDVLINNASAFYPQPIADVSEKSWDDMLGSNLKAPFFLIQALTDSLAQRGGCIVNIIDIHAERGLKGYPVYSITKAGLAGMTKILAKELAPQIRVNGISPGAILWPEAELSGEAKNEILQRIALGYAGEPNDIAKAVAFLCNDANYITGQIISVDGGRTLFC